MMYVDDYLTISLLGVGHGFRKGVIDSVYVTITAGYWRQRYGEGGALSS